MNEFTYQVVPSPLGSDMIRKTDSKGNDFWIPSDPANSDYAQYLASLEATEPEAE
jgi:hypothetical protein